jgi:hypothetical protein
MGIVTLIWKPSPVMGRQRSPSSKGHASSASAPLVSAIPTMNAARSSEAFCLKVVSTTRRCQHRTNDRCRGGRFTIHVGECQLVRFDRIEIGRDEQCVSQL